MKELAKDVYRVKTK